MLNELYIEQLCTECRQKKITRTVLYYAYYTWVLGKDVGEDACGSQSVIIVPSSYHASYLFGGHRACS